MKTLFIFSNCPEKYTEPTTCLHTAGVEKNRGKTDEKQTKNRSLLPPKLGKLVKVGFSLRLKWALRTKEAERREKGA